MTEQQPQTDRARAAERRIDDALRIATSLAEVVESECPTDDGDDICHGHDLYEGRCALATDLERLVSTLGGGRR